jgi:protein phosphatase
VHWLDWIRNLWRPPPSSITVNPSGETTADHPAIPALNVAAGQYQLRVGFVSDRGTVRESNEDNYYVSGQPLSGSGPEAADNGRKPPREEPPRLFVVADGMGGQLAGEKASEMAVSIIPEQIQRKVGAELDERAVQRALREAVAEANQEILAQSHLVPEYANMGTTVVLALFHGHRVHVAGIGDSRAYRLREGRFEQLTQDHSLAQALTIAGTIRPEDVENHRFRNVLYLYLGCKDAREGPDEIASLDLARGDRFLLATDGLTGVVRDDELASLLRAGDDPQRSAQSLLARAIENRSKDNITCIVIHVV